MANPNEMTQSKALGVVLSMVEKEEITLPADVTGKLAEIKASLDNKSAKRKEKAKEVSDEDKAMVQAVSNFMVPNKKYTVGEVVVGSKITCSTSKATNIVRSLPNVVNVKEGKKSLYYVTQ